MPTCTTCSQEIEVASAFCSHCGSPNPEGSGTSNTSDTVLLQRRLQAALGDAFTVEESLGEGGFAVVYGVFDRKLNRRIAVKVLRPELTASRASKQRFVREAETVARLNHPHILPIFFVGEGQGLVYFGMPLVEGETLDARLRREGRLSETEAARIGEEIADALGEAHGAGLVHRDIKPLNVMLQGGRGRVLVADFGIAKAAAGSGESDKLTGTGIAIGSPHYMSPEQASGDDRVDHRSDIYSLGILIWQMLAGDLPFNSGGGSQAVIMQQVSRDVPPIRGVRPDVSPAMAAVVARCTAKSREDRFQSADEVAQALRQVAAATPMTHSGPVRAWASPRVKWSLVAAAILVLGLAGWLVGRPASTPATAGTDGPATAIAATAPVSPAPSIAVLPFSTVGASDTGFGRSAALMLGEALALRNGVGTVDGNSLLSRWLSERRSVTAPLDSNARFAYGMGANQMVIGNYIESGRTFRLSLALYDTHNVTRLWADEVTGSTDSLFTLLDRLATRVAVALCAQPSYNPGNICFDTPARPRTPLALAAAGSDSATPVSFYALVAPTGEVTDIRLQSTGEGERSAQALGVLKDARFEPARRAGRAVEAWTSVEVGVRAPEAARAPARPAGGNCDNSQYAVRNPNHECYDARPVPQAAPVAVAPPSCAGVEPVNVLLRVGAAGAPAGAPTVVKGSGCVAFDEAALNRAGALTFIPATRGGHAVDAWIILQIRPAAAAAGGS